jgi:hypothetical protein
MKTDSGMDLQIRVSLLSTLVEFQLHASAASSPWYTSNRRLNGPFWTTWRVENPLVARHADEGRHDGIFFY